MNDKGKLKLDCTMNFKQLVIGAENAFNANDIYTTLLYLNEAYQFLSSKFPNITLAAKAETAEEYISSISSSHVLIDMGVKSSKELFDYFVNAQNMSFNLFQLNPNAGLNYSAQGSNLEISSESVNDSKFMCDAYIIVAGLYGSAKAFEKFDSGLRKTVKSNPTELKHRLSSLTHKLF
jgi:hypothetical protein